MKSHYPILGWLGIAILAAAAAAQTEQTAAQSPAPGKARINILFLDDAAEGLSAAATVRANHWPEWDARLPTFQKLLRTFIADFHKAQSDKPNAAASQYALEVSAGLNAAERDRRITEHLGAIAQATGRPTLVLARRTVGTDQLRLVYVLDVDCPPRQAAGFLAALAEITPPVFHGRIGERFGPFRAPPTIVFDPRANALAPVPASQKARHRWALLEEEAYLLPHYVLHAVAAVHESLLTEEAAWQRDRTLEAGQLVQQITERLEKAESLRAQGRVEGPWGANHVANQAVNLATKLVDRTNDINALSSLSPRTLEQLRVQSNRVGNDNRTGVAATLVDLTKSAGDGFTVGGIAVTASGAGAVPGVITAGGGFLLGKLGDAGQAASNKYTTFQGRVNDSWDSLKTASQRNYGSQSSPDASRTAQIVAHVMASSPYYRDSGLNNPVQAMKQLDSARTVTFSGSSTKVMDPVAGGVLFEHDNQYSVDVSGRLAKEVAAEARTRRASGGLVMGALRYFDDLALVWLDVADRRNGSLPVGVPRFLIAASVENAMNFGGPWSFEPLALDVRRNDKGRLLRATLTPAETRTPVSYMPFDLGIEGVPPLLAIRNGTGFEPALEATKEGGFVWTLRHGVTIEFNADGLVEAVRSPHGEHVAYVREARQMMGQQTSDGRRIDVRYSGTRPEAIVLGGTPRAAYEYDAQPRLTRARGDRNTWSIEYSGRGRPAKIAAKSASLALEYDNEGRLILVVSGPASTRIEYLERTSTLRFSSNVTPAMDWLLGPISGPVMADRAVLLTRSMGGRILQVSKGAVRGAGHTREFIPSETIALVR